MAINVFNNRLLGSTHLIDGVFLPHENNKADLGTPTKNFENLHCDNLDTKGKDVVTGTWRPSGLYPGSLLEAKYQKINKQVSLYVFSRNFADEIGNLPFPIHQRSFYFIFSKYTDGRDSSYRQNILKYDSGEAFSQNLNLLIADATYQEGRKNKITDFPSVGYNYYFYFQLSYTTI